MKEQKGSEKKIPITRNDISHNTCPVSIVSFSISFWPCLISSSVSVFLTDPFLNLTLQNSNKQNILRRGNKSPQFYTHREAVSVCLLLHQPAAALAAADAVVSLQCHSDCVLQRKIRLSVVSVRDELHVSSGLYTDTAQHVKNINLTPNVQSIHFTGWHFRLQFESIRQKDDYLTLTWSDSFAPGRTCRETQRRRPCWRAGFCKSRSRTQLHSLRPQFHRRMVGSRLHELPGYESTQAWTNRRMNNIMQQRIPVTHSFMLRADLVFEYSLRSDNFVKQMLSDVRVHGRQGIVQ